MTTKRYITETRKLEARQRVDLYTIANCDKLNRKTAREFSGACPFCGGDDRFNVQPSYETGGRWLCRDCTGGVWKDGIELMMRLDNISFPVAVRRILGEPEPITSKRKSKKSTERKTQTKVIVQTPALSQPPSAKWQTAVAKVVDECADYLFNDDDSIAKEQLDFLHKRGLSDETIRNAKLGFNPKRREILQGIWIHPGITIPCIVGENIWYLRTRLTDDAAEKYARYQLSKSGGDGGNAKVVYGENGKRYLVDDAGKKFPLSKYVLLKDSSVNALYNADELAQHQNAIIVEGELDALLLAQEAQDLDVAVVTAGSTTNLPDARWQLRLAHLDHLFIVLDEDEAGKRGLKKWKKAIHFVQPMPSLLKAGEDVTDAFTNGANLEAWCKEALDTSVKL